MESERIYKNSPKKFGFGDFILKYYPNGKVGYYKFQCYFYDDKNEVHLMLCFNIKTQQEERITPENCRAMPLKRYVLIEKYSANNFLVLYHNNNVDIPFKLDYNPEDYYL